MTISVTAFFGGESKTITLGTHLMITKELLKLNFTLEAKFEDNTVIETWQI